MQNYGFLSSDPNVNSPGGDHANILALHQTHLTNNAGTAEPGSTFSHMWWPDETANRLKRRNAANTAWLDCGPLDVGFDQAFGSEYIRHSSLTPYHALTATVTTAAVTVTAAALALVSRTNSRDLQVLSSLNESVAIAALDPNTWHFVYVEANANGAAPSVLVLKLGDPFTKDYTAFVGQFRTDGAGVPRAQTQRGDWVTTKGVDALTNGASTGFVNFSIANTVPGIANAALWQYDLTADAGINPTLFILNDNAIAQVHEFRARSGGALGAFTADLRGTFLMPLTNANTLRYRVSGTNALATITLLGYRIGA